MGICCHGSAVMGLMGMFNLIFLITLGLSVAVDYFAFSSFFADNAQKEVLEQARLILRTAMSVRSYTEDQIQPIITQLDPQDRHFYPQRVPSYAAVESFNYLHAEKKEYSYREAALNQIGFSRSSLSSIPKTGTSIRSGCLRTPPWRVLTTCTPRRRNTATGKRL